MQTYIDFIDKFYKNHPNRKILFLVEAGSRFFNLHTENSDYDYRGIYLPSPKEFHQGEKRKRFVEYKTNGSQNKNNKTDIDFNLFSITKFFDLLKSGDFNMMELLYSPREKIIIDSDYFKNLRYIRSNMLSNDISSFLGFIKKEYRRYGVNINHYKIQLDFVKFLKNYDIKLTLRDIWDDIVEYSKNNSQIILTKSSTGNKHNLVDTIKIAQRFFQSTVRIEYIIEQIEYRLRRYGSRQKNNAEHGVEYKGLYHALRLMYEAEDLIKTKEFQLPFNNYRYKLLRQIKNGNIDKDELFKIIDNKLVNLYELEKGTKSNYKRIENIIDKLKFNLKGKMELKYLIDSIS